MFFLMDHAPLALAGVAGVALCAAWRTTVQVVRRSNVVNSGRAARFQEMESTLEELRASIGAIHSEMPAAPAPEPTVETGNRARAIAMLEKGDSPDLVAAVTGSPRNEIELLLKVHRIVARQSD
jgi:hypothetical protein